MTTLQVSTDVYHPSDAPHIDLSGWNAHTVAGSASKRTGFLMDWTSLKDVNLAPLATWSVRVILDNFLFGCRGLQTVQFHGLTNVKSIGEGFLSECSSLASVDFSGLSGVQTVGGHFMFNCSSITSLSLRGLAGAPSPSSSKTVFVCLPFSSIPHS